MEVAAMVEFKEDFACDALVALRKTASALHQTYRWKDGDTYSSHALNRDKILERLRAMRILYLLLR